MEVEGVEKASRFVTARKKIKKKERLIKMNLSLSCLVTLTLIIIASVDCV